MYNNLLLRAIHFTIKLWGLYLDKFTKCSGLSMEKRIVARWGVNLGLFCKSAHPLSAPWLQGTDSQIISSLRTSDYWWNQATPLMLKGRALYQTHMLYMISHGSGLLTQVLPYSIHCTNPVLWEQSQSPPIHSKHHVMAVTARTVDLPLSVTHVCDPSFTMETRVALVWCLLL